MSWSNYSRLQAWTEAKRKLPALEADLLLSKVLAISRSELYAWPDKPITAAQWQELQTQITKIANGYPLAYLLGEKEFWSLNLKVTPATLIPRPETELLVSIAIEYLNNIKTPYIIDLGTGSGAIALALATEFPQAKIIAIDLDEQALEVARQNAAGHNLTNIEFICNDWLSGLSTPAANLIIANPPYIAINDPHLAALQYEPQLALIAGVDGLAAIKIIIQQAKQYLRPGAMLMLEHGYDQAIAVQQLLRQHNYQDINSSADLSGWLRVTASRW